jgi:hypothetical protein
MNEATVSQEFIDKATVALNKSAFWEFADCPVTIRLAIRQAEIDGRRVNNAARSAARLLIRRVRDPLVRKFVSEIATATDVEEYLTEFETYRDTLIMKVAEEFSEVEKASSVKDYRLKRTQRVAITGRRFGKRTLAEMCAA